MKEPACNGENFRKLYVNHIPQSDTSNTKKNTKKDKNRKSSGSK